MRLFFVILVAFVFGVIITVFGYQMVTIYQYRKQAAADHATLTQIVDFLNGQIRNAQGTAEQSTPSTKK